MIKKPQINSKFKVEKSNLAYKHNHKQKMWLLAPCQSPLLPLLLDPLLLRAQFLLDQIIPEFS